MMNRATGQESVWLADGSREAMATRSRYVIAEHHVLRAIGEGSYGEVWLARTAIGAYRAVKIVDCSAGGRESLVDRELAGILKFEPISRSHEGLVDVLQVGRSEACFYYVMELGDDLNTGPHINPRTYVPKTLAKELARRGRLPVTECVELGLILSDALAYLHTRGLVHRDVKPSNIIFVNGVPKLADIGLVADITNAKSYVGTMGFIPPEGPSSAQADIYSLGKVLYEISTGLDRMAFPEFPEGVCEFGDAHSFLELNEIILKACHPDRHLRYKSAKEMHVDLTLLHNGKSVRRLRLLERQFVIAKRAGLMGVCAVMVLAGITSVQTWKRQVLADARLPQLEALAIIADGGAGNLGHLNAKQDAVLSSNILSLISQRASAEKGSGESQYELGIRYLRGCGVKVDLERAKFWLRLAAKQGHPDAQELLEKLFAHPEITNFGDKGLQAESLPQDDLGVAAIKVGCAASYDLGRTLFAAPMNRKVEKRNSEVSAVELTESEMGLVARSPNDRQVKKRRIQK